MGKGLHKLFKAVVNKLSESLPILGESGSKVSYFVPELRNLSKKNITRRHKETLVKCKYEGD